VALGLPEVEVVEVHVVVSHVAKKAT